MMAFDRLRFRTIAAAALALGLVPVAPPASRAAEEHSVDGISLAEAIAEAERIRPAVLQAEGALRNAEEAIRAAYGAYLPSLSASSSGANSYSEGISRTDPVTGQVVSGDRTSTSVSLGLSSRLDLFTGFRRGADLRAARSEREAAGAGLVDARFQLKLDVTQEFLNALYYRQLTGVRRTGVRRAEEQLHVATAKLRTGSATRSDSLRSLVTLGTARLDLLSTEARLAQAEANLARLVGRPGRVAAADDSSFRRVTGSLDTLALRREAEASSPRAKSASASAGAAQAALAAARAAYWPTVSLSGNFNYSGSDQNDYRLFQQRQLGLSLSWPLFDRFSRERTITSRRASLEVARAQAGDAAREVQAALTAQLANLDAARARIEITEESVRAAEEDLRVQQERYRLGAATIVEVLTSQEALAQAEVNGVNARFDYLRAKAEIEALLGREL